MSEALETDPHGVQNEFFNEARKTRARVILFLVNGKRLVGRIRAFDRFAVILDEGGEEQMVFKHAIATVATSRRERGGEVRHNARPGGEARGEPRPGGGETLGEPRAGGGDLSGNADPGVGAAKPGPGEGRENAKPGGSEGAREPGSGGGTPEGRG